MLNFIYKYNNILKTLFIILFSLVIIKLDIFLNRDDITYYVIRLFILMIFVSIFYLHYKSPISKSKLNINRLYLYILPILFLLYAFLSFSIDYSNTKIINRIIMFSLLIGISEELIFRGVFYKLLIQYSRPFYLIVSSLLFALLHYEQGIGQIMFTFIVGLSFGLSRIAGSHVIILILLHTAIDFLGLMPHHNNIFVFDIFILFFYVIFVSILYLSFPTHWKNQKSKNIVMIKVINFFLFISMSMIILVFYNLYSFNNTKQKNKNEILLKSPSNKASEFGCGINKSCL